MHARIAERIVKTAQLPKDATVLEVGPGRGILTRELLKVVKKVIAVEVDKELFEKLQTDFVNELKSKRLELMYGDIRNCPYFHTTVQKWGYHIVANIPYYLTGEIFRLFLTAERQPSSMTLLVQKEVAERVVARKKKPLNSARGKESILSLSVKAYGTPKYEFTVPRGAFKPAPKVDSAVLSVRGISRENFAAKKEEERFFALLHAGFAHKRKYVRKNLTEAGFSLNAPQGGASGEPPLAVLAEGARAEDLPLATWLALCR